MKSRITPLVAALLLAGAAPFAYAQATATAEVASPATYANAPVASVSKSDDLANTIAQALITDASLKDSKITVQPEADGAILLTGVTATNVQRQKAVEIASSHAGVGKVTNALISSEIVVSTTPPVTAATAPQDAATAPQDAATAPKDTLAVASDFVAAPEPVAQPAAAAQPAAQPELAPTPQPAATTK